MIPSLRNIFWGSLIASLIPLSCFAIETTKIDMKTMTKDQMNDACFNEGKNYGVKTEGGEPVYKIHPECRIYVEFLAKEKQRATSDNKDVRVVAALNLIYIDIDMMIKDKKVTKKHIISGPMANLHTIESVILSPDSKYLAVVHSVPKGWGSLMDNNTDEPTQEHVEKEIKIFNATFNGNVSPRYVLRDKEINKAKTIAFNPSASELLIVNELTNQIITFSTRTDYRLQNKKLRPKSLRKLSPSEKTFREPASIEFINDNSLLVLDAKNSNVVAIDLLSNEPQWVLDSETIGLNQLAHIRYNDKDKKLIISDEAGNKVEFDKE